MSAGVISSDEVENDMWEIVLDQGEKYVDPNAAFGCVYVDLNRPSCMVGRYLIEKHDVPLDYFDELITDQWGDENAKNRQEIKNLWADLNNRFGLSFEPEAKNLLERMQENQDCGNTWGYAYKNAIDPSYYEDDED